MTIKVLILGEGATDVGTEDGATGKWLNGCIISLIKKVNNKVSLSYHPVSKSALPKTVAQKGKRKFEGHGKNIQKLIILAQLNKIEYDIIIYFGDTDKESGTRNNLLAARRASKIAYRQAHDTFEFFEKRGIAIIPLRMLESWLLTDEQAFYRAFGSTVSLPKNPELLWGDKYDPLSNYPKYYLQRILSSVGQECNRETFCSLVEHMNLVTLEDKCPISTNPFLEKAKAYLI